MGLKIKAFALTCGIMWGLAVLFTTAGLVALGCESSCMDTLGCFYLGYSVSWPGAVIGGIWGFVDGLVGGAAFAWLYNKISGAQ